MMNSRIQVGIAPINWCNDDMPELGKDIPLEQCLAEMHETGYEGTELGHKFPKTVEELRSVLDAHGLSLAAMWHSTYFVANFDFEQELIKLRQTLELLAGVGAKIINLAECSYTVHSEKDKPLTEKPNFSQQKWDMLTYRLNRAGEICREYGIKAAIHHHMGTGIQSLEEIDRLMENTDPDVIYLCADTGHLKFAGIDPLMVFKKYINRIAHVHLKDLREENVKEALKKDSSFLDAVLSHAFTVPGDGMIDFKPILDVLQASSYEGWVIVEAEQDPARANPFHYARLARNYLNKIANI